MRLGLSAMIRKEFRQIFRDPRTLGILLLVPMILLILFGYAISMDVESVQVAVIDGDRTPESRRTAAMFSVLDLFEPVAVPEGRDAEDLMVDGEADAVVVIPPGYGRELAGGRTPSVQVLIDGSNITVASTAQSSIEGAFADLSVRTLSERRLPRPGGMIRPAPPLDFRPRTWFNPELRSTIFLVPGLVSFIMVITAVISTALSVVREKERGTMEMLEASPLPPAALILGKVIPYMIISLLETTLIFVAGRLAFGLVIQGSLLLLLLAVVLFLLSCLGLGLIISTIAETQQTAFLIATVTTVLPTFILSGFVFPIRNMPVLIQAVTRIIPARYFLEVERAVIIRGAGFGTVWPQLAILAFLSVFTLGVSSVRLAMSRRKR